MSPIDRSKLVRIKKGEENRGVTPQQRKNLAIEGQKMAEKLGIDKPIPGIAIGTNDGEYEVT